MLCAYKLLDDVGGTERSPPQLIGRETVALVRDTRGAHWFKWWPTAMCPVDPEVVERT